MSRIAVDLDDTLYPFGQLAREMFVEIALERGDKRLQRGAYCAWGEWRSPEDVTGHDEDLWPYVIERCHQPDVILDQQAFAGAADTLRDLVEEGHELLYISNRSPDVWEATQAWLAAEGFPWGELICTMADKRPLLCSCQYLIDDRPKTLVEFVYDYDWKKKYAQNKGRVRKGFGLFGEHNRAVTDIPSIWLAPNWKLLRQYLIEKEVLHAVAVYS